MIRLDYLKAACVVILLLFFMEASKSQTNDFTSAKVVRAISDSVSTKIKSDSIMLQLKSVEKRIHDAALRGENYVKIVRSSMLEDNVIDELRLKKYYVTGTSYIRNYSPTRNKYIWVYSYYIGW